MHGDRTRGALAQPTKQRRPRDPQQADPSGSSNPARPVRQRSLEELLIGADRGGGDQLDERNPVIDSFCRPGLFEEGASAAGIALAQAGWRLDALRLIVVTHQ